MAWHCEVEQIQALLDGELGDRERQECEAHLAGCRYCASLMQRLASISGALGSAGAASPPAGLREHILEAVAQADPVPELPCERALEMSSAYLDGELRELEREALEAHLFACPDCYRAFKQMEAAAEALHAQGRLPAPAGLHQRIVAAVEREQRQPEGVLGVIGAWPKWRKAVGVAAGLAAAAAVLAALFLPGGQQPAPLQPMADTVAETVQPVEAPEPVVAKVSDETEPGATAAAGVPPPAAARVADEPRTSTRDRGRDTVAVNPPVRREVRAETTERTIVEPPPRPAERVEVASGDGGRSEAVAPTDGPAREPTLAMADGSAEGTVAGAVADPAEGAGPASEGAVTRSLPTRPTGTPAVAVARDSGGPSVVAETPTDLPPERTEPTRIASAAGAAEVTPVTPLLQGYESIPLDATDPGESCAAATAAIKAIVRSPEASDREPAITIW